MITNSQSRIFISYSSGGAGLKWKESLLQALRVFEKHHLLDVWEDGKLRIGSDWDDDIKQAMKSAHIAVLLLTKEALDTKYILDTEFPFLRERQELDQLLVVPVICEPCNWKNHEWLRATQAPNRTNPLSEISRSAQDSAFRKLATDIANELSRIALSFSCPSDGERREVKTYLDKFPLTRSAGLREEKLIGRHQELALLDLAFAQPHTAIVSLVAWGGVGKTMLVQHWLQHLEHEGWFGARRVYAWSFYSQGTQEDRQASEDTFLAHALVWFGVQCEPTLSLWDKGRLLADAVAREHTLLILDGIEPLQYPPGPMVGQIRAPGVQSLLKQLARNANLAKSESATDLCLVATREPLTDLADFQRREGSPWGSVLRVDLCNLPEQAGAALLHYAGANRAGAEEIKPDDTSLLAASREVDGHALTLNLLGRFLARAHSGDILLRYLVKFEEADRKEQGGSTFKMLTAFENWFKKSGEFGPRLLCILQMLGLFDRPVEPDLIAVLRQSPSISGLTTPIFDASIRLGEWKLLLSPICDEDWNRLVSELEDLGLVVSIAVEPRPRSIKGYKQEVAERLLNSAAFNTPYGYSPWCPPLTPGIAENVFTKDELRHFRYRCLDTHPLIREFFSSQMRTARPRAWLNANARLFSYLKLSVPFWPEGIAGLHPLFQAILHGCRSGRINDAREILRDRVYRGTNGSTSRYSKTLGAVNENLAALACFFDVPWKHTAPGLSRRARMWLYFEAAEALCDCNRLREAVDPLTIVMEYDRSRKSWREAMVTSGALSELHLLLGSVSDAVRIAREGMRYAELCPDFVCRDSMKQSFSDALLAEGRRIEACLSLRLLYLSGELFLDEIELAAWQSFITSTMNDSNAATLTELVGRHWSAQQAELFLPTDQQWVVPKLMDYLNATFAKPTPAGLIQNCLEFEHKIIEEGGRDLLPDDRILMARVALCRILLLQESWKSLSDLTILAESCSQAVTEIRKTNIAHRVVRALIYLAWIKCVQGNKRSAIDDLDEAMDIADHGPMRLHIVDIHLYRARLFFREKFYPWKSAQADLTAAETLINDCGYHRRDEELADAKRVIFTASF